MYADILRIIFLYLDPPSKAAFHLTSSTWNNIYRYRRGVGSSRTINIAVRYRYWKLFEYFYKIRMDVNQWQVISDICQDPTNVCKKILKVMFDFPEITGTTLQELLDFTCEE